MMLDLEYEILEDMSYPKFPRAKHGCVRVERSELPKTILLPEIAKVLVENQ